MRRVPSKARRVANVFSAKALGVFEDASASIPLRQLDRAFESAGLRRADDPREGGGARRTQFRRYVAGVNQLDPRQRDQLGAALGALIAEVAESKQEFLVRAAERDGFLFADGVFRPSGAPVRTRFPAAVPEIPVRNVDTAAEYYVKVLGFRFDWGDDEGGIGGISLGDCRMFLTNAPFRRRSGNRGSVVVWLNLDSKEEVDELHGRWKAAGANIVAPPEDTPWNLREFRIADPDGNQLRIFHDFSPELDRKQH